MIFSTRFKTDESFLVLVDESYIAANDQQGSVSVDVTATSQAHVGAALRVYSTMTCMTKRVQDIHDSYERGYSPKEEGSYAVERDCDGSESGVCHPSS